MKWRLGVYIQEATWPEMRSAKSREVIKIPVTLLLADSTHRVLDPACFLVRRLHSLVIAAVSVLTSRRKIAVLRSWYFEDGFSANSPIGDVCSREIED